MGRLNFKLDEFVRVAWVSAQARDRWDSIFSELSHLFLEIEKRSVPKYREAALVYCSPDELLQLTQEMSSVGLVVAPVDRNNVSSHYRSAASELDPKLPWTYKVVIAKSHIAKAFISAYMEANWMAVGHLLGYPSCCVGSFSRYWVEEQWMDTTWPMYRHWALSDVVNLRDQPIQTNMMLRALGLRMISHLPCSPYCSESFRIAGKNKEIAIHLKREASWSKLEKILSWPVEWSSLHGIAIVTTPVCKIVTASDAFATKKIVKLPSEEFPKEIGKGLKFPFTADNNWSANGFPSATAMHNAHDAIIGVLRSLNPKSVVDLGCGNGQLLGRIKAVYGAETLGVDISLLNHPDRVEDLYSWNPSAHYDVVLCAFQRTREKPEAWALLEDRIKDHCHYLLLYDYSTGEIEIRDHRNDKKSIRGSADFRRDKRSRGDVRQSSHSGVPKD